MKYLIVECNELGDQWECDADRKPVCITEDKWKYWEMGFEIYEINEDNTFTLIKNYEDAGEEGMALYYWGKNDDCEQIAPTIVKKWKNKDRDFFTKSKIKNIKSEIGFSETANSIYLDISHCGSHGETIGDKYYVLGEYRDNNFDYGY